MLLELPIGTKARVIGIFGGGRSRMKIMALGIREGDIIEVLYKGAFGGPILVKNLLTGAQIALGRGIASRIRVEPV